jgi:hypothetical protein
LTARHGSATTRYLRGLGLIGEQQEYKRKRQAPAPWSGAKAGSGGAVRKRSVNDYAHQTHSDPYARDKSEGHRPKACGLSELAMGFAGAAVSGNLLKEMAGVGWEVAWQAVGENYIPTGC